MDMISEIITGVVLSGTVLFTAITSCAKIKKMNTPHGFMILFYTGLISLIVVEGLCLVDHINYIKFEVFVGVILPMLNSIVLAIYAFFIIDERTPKKMKTLWRLPIIGLLLGYMGPDYQLYVNFGLYIVTLFIFIKNYQKLRILTGNMFALFIWVVSLSFIRENGFWYLNIILLFFNIITYKLWNMISIKVISWDQNEAK